MSDNDESDNYSEGDSESVISENVQNTVHLNKPVAGPEAVKAFDEDDEDDDVAADIDDDDADIDDANDDAVDDADDDDAEMDDESQAGGDGENNSDSDNDTCNETEIKYYNIMLFMMLFIVTILILKSIVSCEGGFHLNCILL